MNFVINRDYTQTGSVYSLELALRSIDAERNLRHLLLIEGDVVIDRDLIARLLERGTADSAATLLAPYEPHLSGTFAVVEGDKVTAWLHESVRSSEFDLRASFKTVNLTFVQRGIPRIRLLNQVSQVITRSGAQAPLEYAMQTLIQEGLPIGAVTINGAPWFEVDTPEDLMIANELFPPSAELS